MGTITHSNHNTLITVLVDACENMVMKKPQIWVKLKDLAFNLTFICCLV